MYRAAYRHDEETVIYFDAFDNKWVAKGNSLSWRTNNPGLLYTREIGLTHNASVIGKHHHIAIFCSAREGVKALKEWLRSQKQQRDLLRTIAKRRNAHEVTIQRVANVTVLDDTSAWICEHGISTSCYKSKIKELVNRYKNQYAKSEPSV
jgi:hypothetical protein